VKAAMPHHEARMLVVADNAVDVEQVCGMLRGKYPHIQASADPAAADAAFDRVKPHVLVLAFKSIEARARFYLGLYRRSKCIHTQARSPRQWGAIGSHPGHRLRQGTGGARPDPVPSGVWPAGA